MHHPKITIQKVINGGYGLSRLPSNQVMLVENVLPGEVVIVTTQVAKKNYLFGKVVEFEECHPKRIAPPCAYYGRCGGCNFQHCSYDLQLQLKNEILKELLCRQDRDDLKMAADLVTPVLPSLSQFNYRQRIKLQVGHDGAVGFYRHRSHDIIEIESCMLAPDLINSTLQTLRRDEAAGSLLAISSEVELLENPSTQGCVCIFNLNRKPRPADRKRAIQICENNHFIERVFLSGEDFQLQGPFHRSEIKTEDNLLTFISTVNESGSQRLQLSWEAGSFCQVNLCQNNRLIDQVISLFNVDKNETVLDLYCGLGNFSIPIAHLAKSVIGIEGQGSAIRSAKHNAKLNKLSNTMFLKKPVHIACKELLHDQKSFDCVLLDPPRQGAPELASALSTLCKKKLLYVSCDPATLCRDLDSLLNVGFHIKTISPVDMFPQTHHIETITLLQK